MYKILNISSTIHHVFFKEWLSSLKVDIYTGIKSYIHYFAYASENDVDRTGDVYKKSFLLKMHKLITWKLNIKH